ncbi:uncharacterized protein YdiU (UPF0061 family) [Allofrancisella inopinata]|uniref:Protein nucleotidyltransferase YdiU n=1 Tax=Allofrancisella inopinata TaxID=1085647 RepID=A0AAE6YJP7_9GAMM|nr:YdiU family protein [Allofrancisella inopinata]QIV95989.1 YdiU family protein [Allofrancisella inopinata]TDT74411.1 uncharacterized protein YdiU (UPF0061 family) [Allofrancisella inopinata]
MLIPLEYSYLSLPAEFYSKQSVYKYPKAKLLAFNNVLAKELDLKLEQLDEPELLDFLLGHQSENPIAQAYAGHQFGHFTMLGDGRAILTGEYKKSDGTVVDIHLKGAGLTKFSRGGDGKAILGPMLREYIVSEAMHNLNIPTSRILAVITTGENVQRQSVEQGAIAIRVASSHIRVGTFQYAAMLGKNYSQSLLDYTIKRHNIPYGENKALGLLNYVMDKQTSLITQWERVGFIHGVMNTDNMTISGETIDYGPCAFMDKYDPETVFSSIDRNGRYAFANQAPIGGWNIARLAESLLSLISEDEKEAISLAEEALTKYSEIYKTKWQKMFLSKLGLASYQNEDESLISELLIEMYKNNLDYTNTFYNLSYQHFEALRKQGLANWLDKWVSKAPKVDTFDMRQVNPFVIPRNHQVEKAIKSAESGDLGDFYNLNKALKHPYKFDKKYQSYMLEPTEDQIVKATYCGT